MSIVALDRVSVCGLLKEKRSVLADLQALGCIHLESLREAPAEPEKVAPEHAEGARRALRYLHAAPRKRRQVSDAREFSVDQTVQAVLDNMQQTRDTGDRRDFLARRLEDLRPWGDFRLPGSEGLNGYLLWFYIVPHKDMALVRDSDLTWQIVHASVDMYSSSWARTASDLVS